VSPADCCAGANSVFRLRGMRQGARVVKLAPAVLISVSGGLLV
jgi:hypothetical protein